MSPISVQEALEPDLFRGLALEEWLLEKGGTPSLLLWRGGRGGVMGKNQNPWREINLAWLHREGSHLARRCSGGGAVYHDAGNLNIAWVVDRVGHQPALLHALLRGALERLGVPAEVAPSGAIFARGRKLSGVAYCHRRDRVLQHATLLVDADLAALRASLSAPRVRLRSHAVPSIPAQVANLVDFLPGLGVQQVAQAIRREAIAIFGGEIEAGQPPGAEVREMELRLRSPAWIWDQTPAFVVELDLGGVPREFEVRKGRLRPRNTLHAAEEGIPFRKGVAETLALRWGCPVTELRQALAAQGFLEDLLPPDEMVGAEGLEPTTLSV